MSHLPGRGSGGHGLPRVRGSWPVSGTQEEARGRFARKEKKEEQKDLRGKNKERRTRQCFCPAPWWDFCSKEKVSLTSGSVEPQCEHGEWEKSLLGVCRCSALGVIGATGRSPTAVCQQSHELLTLSFPALGNQSWRWGLLKEEGINELQNKTNQACPKIVPK